MYKPRSAKFFAIETSDGTFVHAEHPTGNYASLCGLDGNDPHPAVGHFGVKEVQAKQLTCNDCIAIVNIARKYRVPKNWRGR